MWRKLSVVQNVSQTSALTDPPEPSLSTASYTRLPSKKEKAAPTARPRMRKKVMREPAVSQSFPRTILVSRVSGQKRSDASPDPNQSNPATHCGAYAMQRVAR